MIETIKKECHIQINLIGIGIEMTDYQSFKDEGYFNGKIYINEGKSLYKNLNLKKSKGCCDLYGMSCRLFKIASKAKEKKMENNLKGDKLQYGGELIIKNDVVLLLRSQKDPTDLIEKEEILKVIDEVKKDE